MSRPNVMVEIGESDWLDLEYRSSALNMQADSRLRTAQSNTTGAPDYQKFGCHKVVTLSSQPVYAEASVDANAAARWHFGAGQYDASGGSGWTSGGGMTVDPYVIIRGGGDFYMRGVNTASAGVLPTGARVGMKLWKDGATIKAQFTVNGVPHGGELSDASGDGVLDVVRLGVSFGSSLGVATLYLDADEQLYLPSDCQPWGAAARVADAGGYSPAASQWTRWGPNVTVDAFARTLVNTTVSDSGAAYAENKASVAGRSGLLYVEFLVEARPGGINGPMCGLSPRGTGTGTYPGAQPDSVGIFGSASQTFNDATATATDATVAVAGDRYGLFYRPSDGAVWFSRNETILTGDPEAGTGPRYTGLTGDMVPACTIYNDGNRVRLCTHAREQKYRPHYAEAWDGADVLPERHFRGLLGNDPYVERGYWLRFPWGGSGGQGAPIGAIELLNADGRYDGLSEWGLRDQPVSVYEIEPDQEITAHVARGSLDSVAAGLSKARVLVQRFASNLERRVADRQFVVGTCLQVKLPQGVSTASSDPRFLLSESLQVAPAGLLQVSDQGLGVETWAFAEQDDDPGTVRRTVNPAGVHHANLRAFRIEEFELTNADFASWSGDNPTGWNIDEYAYSYVTEEAGRARLVHQTGVGGGNFRLWQGIVNPTGAVGRLVEVTVDDYVEGDIALEAYSLPLELRPYGVFEPGRYIGWSGLTADVEFRPADLGEDTSVRVTQIRTWDAFPTDQPSGAIRYLLEDVLGLDSASYLIGSALTAEEDLGQFSECGILARNEPTVREVLQQLCDSWIIGFYPDEQGRTVFDSPREAPEEATAELELRERELGDLKVEDDLAPGLSDGCFREYAWDLLLEDEVAGAALPVSEHGPIVRLPAGSFDPFYQHAIGAAATPFRGSAPALKDGLRPWELWVLADQYPSRRRFFTASVPLAKARLMRPMQVVSATHSRYGLASGRNLRVVSLRRQLAGPRVRVRFWG